MKRTSINNWPSKTLVSAPRFVRITKAQWEAEQAERYKFAFVPEIAKSHGNR